MSNDFNDFMGFDPKNLDVFQEKVSTQAQSNVYNTNPVKYSKSEDKHYHSSIRLLYNPFNVRASVIPQTKYVCTDENGLFFVDSSLSIGDKNCPMFKAWKTLHFSKDPNKVSWAKTMFQKREAQWCMIQVIEDDNRPELVGKFMEFKLPKAIWDKLQDKMNPSADSKKQPVPIMDYLFGPLLSIDVVPGPAGDEMRQISYNLCDFESDAYPIIKVDGTQLFDDEQLELIERYNNLNKAIQKAKTDKAKKEKQAEKDSIADDVKALYKIALDYMKENAFNIEETRGFTPLTEDMQARVNHWIERVLDMKDPQVPSMEMIVENNPMKNIDVDGEGNLTVKEVESYEESEDDIPF